MTATFTAVTDSQGSYFVRTPAGDLHRDAQGVLVYGSAVDAVEVAAALTEDRPIQPVVYPFVSVWQRIVANEWTTVRYGAPD